jgi:hypothetical protein
LVPAAYKYDLAVSRKSKASLKSNSSGSLNVKSSLVSLFKNLSDIAWSISSILLPSGSRAILV